MRALIDGDILRYEIGFAAETGWKALREDPEALPPWDYVEDMLAYRLQHILNETGADRYTIYLSEGKNFRYSIAKTKPYKGNRVDKKPWHFDNITVVMKDVLGAVSVHTIEADDALAMEHLHSEEPTVICSRDKDLRQVPGLFFSWELGHQPQFGPVEIDPIGTLELEKEKRKLSGTGYAFFCAQLLTGDNVDNIPGLPKCGPVKAYEILKPILDMSPAGLECRHMYEAVLDAYHEKYGNEAGEHLLEQGQLLWMVRRCTDSGVPQLWSLGQCE